MKTLLCAAFGTIGVGLGWFALEVSTYLASGQAPSSTSGLRVFRVDGQLAAFDSYTLGPEKFVIGIGLVLLLAALLAGAIRHHAERD